MLKVLEEKKNIVNTEENAKKLLMNTKKTLRVTRARRKLVGRKLNDTCGGVDDGNRER